VRLNGALDFCAGRGLRLYRMTSALFPFADDEAGSDVLAEFSERMPAAYRRVPFIEVEAKHKELAIERLTTDWLNA
jgi:UV DNA damage repair endonuclease